MNHSFSFSDPDSALAALTERLATVSEIQTVKEPVGRILAQPVLADRDSPAADVSAMDGFAIRLEDLNSRSPIEISGESKAGAAPPSMVAGKVIRIFTGAIVPDGCEAIVKREDTEESATSIRFRPEALESTVSGSHIRRRGENAPSASRVLEPGIEISPATIAALANFGCTAPSCFRPVKVAVLTTGDEVVDPTVSTLQPWQLRNSNRSAVLAMLQRHAFCQVDQVDHLEDDPDSVAESIGNALRSCDAVVLTGGVSKGDYDYVPETIGQVGGEIVFHGLPIRPGKPILGAATKNGKLLLGLPGNPVSATINAHRFLLPLLRRIAGQQQWRDVSSMVTLIRPPLVPVPLHTMPLVNLTDNGTAELVSTKGSGDLVALAQSDGYVSIPPLMTTTGPWPMFRW